jgi:adenylosuccinate lyase
MVGASLLARVVNDDAGNLTLRGVLETIASKLAQVLTGAKKLALPYRTDDGDRYGNASL